MNLEQALKALADREAEQAKINAELAALRESVDKASKTSAAAEAIFKSRETALLAEIDVLKAKLPKEKVELDPLIKAQLDEIAKTRESLEKMRADIEDEAAKQVFIGKAASVRNLPITTQDLGTLLMKMSKGPLDRAEIDKVVALFVAADTIASVGNPTAALGSRIGKSVTANDRAGAMAETLMKSDPSLTRQQAIAKVYSTHPELYDLYNSQMDNVRAQ